MQTRWREQVAHECRSCGQWCSWKLEQRLWTDERNWGAGVARPEETTAVHRHTVSKSEGLEMRREQLDGWHLKGQCQDVSRLLIIIIITIIYWSILVFNGPEAETLLGLGFTNYLNLNILQINTYMDLFMYVHICIYIYIWQLNKSIFFVITS